jgi:hypothetical protein
MYPLPVVSWVVSTRSMNIAPVVSYVVSDMFSSISTQFEMYSQPLYNV